MAAATEPTARLASNLDAVRARLEAAAASCGREPSDVRLCAVTKSVPASIGVALGRLGATELGENRLPGLEDQRRALEAAGVEARLHFIGHIQRNKARRVLASSDVIHSVDSVRLLETLARLTEETERSVEIYLQVFLTGEAEKHGLDEAALIEAFELARQAPNLQLAGLMAMGPREDRPGYTTRDVFARAAALGSALFHQDPHAFVRGRCELSLGMSGDLEEAVAAGSTLLRVGSALFEGLDARGGAR